MSIQFGNSISQHSMGGTGDFAKSYSYSFGRDSVAAGIISTACFIMAGILILKGGEKSTVIEL